MIVDDSEPDQYLAQHIIEEFDPNIEILTAFDGQEALDILGGLSQQPDVIFLDINMPRMNGHEFLAEYETWDNCSVVIIMLTSSDQDLDKEKSKAHKSVIDYFTKPLAVSQLEKVSVILTQKKTN
jgi:CheY-like chemotaxis protein